MKFRTHLQSSIAQDRSGWEDTALNYGHISNLAMYEKGSSEEFLGRIFNPLLHKIGPAEKTQY